VNLLLAKNAKINWRNKTTLCCHIFAPICVLFVIIQLSFLTKLIFNKTSSIETPIHIVADFPKCQKFKKNGNCTTIGYAVLGEEKEWITFAM